MGFMSGVITGVAVAAGAAAWYMSRSGDKFREQYRVDRKLGELGDQIEARTREIQSTVNAQFAEMRASDAETGPEAALDDAQASAAEAAAELAADVEARAAKVKKAAKDVANAASE